MPTSMVAEVCPWVLEKRCCRTMWFKVDPFTVIATVSKKPLLQFAGNLLKSPRLQQHGRKDMDASLERQDDGLDGLTRSLRPSLQSIGLSIDATSCPGMSVSELCTAHSTSSLTIISAQVVDRQSTIGPRAIPGRRRNACGKPWATTGTIVANDDRRMAGG